MFPTKLIGIHLKESNLKYGIEENLNSICAFTGEKITRGVKLATLIKATFTDHEYIKYKSLYASVEVALCIEETVISPKSCAFTGEKITRGIAIADLLKKRLLGKKIVSEFAFTSNYIGEKAVKELALEIDKIKVTPFLNSLRNYNYFVTNEKLELVSRGKLLELILSTKSQPFILVATYSNKKHTAYKAKVNYNSNCFTVTTDVQNVEVDLERVNKYLSIIQNWYSVIKGKETASQLPTYFTKQEILTGKLSHQRMIQYGIEKSIKENNFLESFRNSPEFELLTFTLNKKV